MSNHVEAAAGGTEAARPARRARRAAGTFREQQLLESALDLFSRAGYRETTLQELADHLGITRPLLYYYFQSKEDLLFRLIGGLGDTLHDRARPIFLSRADPIKKLTAVFKIHAETLLEHPDAFRIYFAERNITGGEGQLAFLNGENEYMNMLTQVVGRGQTLGQVRRGRPRVVALCAVNLLNSTLRWYSPAGDLSAAEIAALISDMALAAIKAPISAT